MFDVDTLEQTGQLQAEMGNEGDWFGKTCAMDNKNIVVGAQEADHPVANAGSAYIFEFNPEIDTDGDGLLDSWETDGIDVNNDGTVDLDLPAMGADPMHKDLFVEVDVMEGSEFLFDAQIRVQDAFANAPVENPDGTNGINLHIFVEDGDTIPFDEVWDVGDERYIDHFASKDVHLGTQQEREGGNWDNIQAARLKTFRYCSIINDIETAGGRSVGTPANDFYMMFGHPDDTDDWKQARRFMHELGHNLNLRHGSAVNTNHKPNYVSVMNYSFREFNNSSGQRLPIDYSREAMDSLNESSLNENTPFMSVLYSDVFVLHGYMEAGNPKLQQFWIQPSLPRVDWNHDGQNDSSVSVDLNHVRPTDDPSPGETLHGACDWDLISLPIVEQASRNGDGHDHRDLTNEEYELFAASLPPIPINVAQITGAEMARGTILDGDDEDLVDADQATLHTRSAKNLGGLLRLKNSMDLEIGASSPIENPATLSVLVRVRMDKPGVIARIRLWNWGSNKFDVVQTYRPEVYQGGYFVQDVAAEPYVNQNGDIKVSLSHGRSPRHRPLSRGNLALALGYEAFFDQIQITVRE